jgi:hypothetical protein
MSRIAYVLAAAALSSLIASGGVIAQPASPTTPAATASDKAAAKVQGEGRASRTREASTSRQSRRLGRALRETQQAKVRQLSGLASARPNLRYFGGDTGEVWFLEHSPDKVRITPFGDCPRLLILPPCARGFGGYSCSRSRLLLSAADLDGLHSARRLTNRAIPALTSLPLMIMRTAHTPSTPCTMPTMMTARRKNRRPIRRASSAAASARWAAR